MRYEIRSASKRFYSFRCARGYSSGMGRLEYNSSRPPIVIEDETLAHLKIIIGTKLRRQESFMMTWQPVNGSPDARLTAWISPSIPLVFAFDDPKTAAVDPARITRMMESLNAHGELLVDHLTKKSGEKS